MLKHRSILGTALLAAVASMPARAETVSLAVPPVSFVLIPPGNPASGAYDNYPAGSWRMAQWNTPDEATVIQNTCELGYVVNSAESSAFRIKARTTSPCYAQPPAAPPSLITTFWQTGANLLCTIANPDGGQISREFNTPVAPNPRSLKPAALAMSLAEMGSLRQKVEFKSTFEDVRSERCSDSFPRYVTNGNAHVVLTFRYDNGLTGDLRVRQTFFYAVVIRYMRSPQDPGWWATGTDAVGEHVSDGRRFGFRDNVTKFHNNVTGAMVRPVDKEVRVVLDIDLLPRIKEAIRTGKLYDMEQNLANWHIGGTYWGQHIWGDVEFATEWRDWSILVRRVE